MRTIGRRTGSGRPHRAACFGRAGIDYPGPALIHQGVRTIRPLWMVPNRAERPPARAVPACRLQRGGYGGTSAVTLHVHPLRFSRTKIRHPLRTTLGPQDRRARAAGKGVTWIVTPGQAKTIMPTQPANRSTAVPSLHLSPRASSMPPTPISILLTLIPVAGRSKRPIDPELITTVDYWKRMDRLTPAYKDPRFDVLAVQSGSALNPKPSIALDRLEDRLADIVSDEFFDSMVDVKMTAKEIIGWKSAVGHLRIFLEKERLTLQAAAEGGPSGADDLEC